MEGETLGKTLFFFTVKFQKNHKLLISNYLKLLFFFNLFIFFCSYTGYRVLLKVDLMSIIADGEEVIFEGEIPSEPSRIYELLMNAYSEQSKGSGQILCGWDGCPAGRILPRILRKDRSGERDPP